MKKIFIALAVLLSVSVSLDAQVKSVADAKKAVENAKAATLNEKKATKSATWVKLGTTYIEAYSAAQGAGWKGAPEAELQVVLAATKPISEEQVVMSDAAYRKEVYPTANYYFRNGILELIEITTPVVPDALGEAVEAFKKAASIDHSKDKDIIAGLKDVSLKYMDEAVLNYTKGDFAASSKCFKKSYEASKTAPYSKIDTLALYNTGFTAQLAGDDDAAFEAFEACRQIGYYNNEGEVFSNLAAIYAKKGDSAQQKALLEEGFNKYPQSQSILFGLINYYIASGEDTGKLFTLLDEAKKKEPNNASLYYVEGNIYKQLGNMESAVAAYDKTLTINPDYEYGLIGKGILFYEDAVEIAKKAAEELDDAKYMVLAEKCENQLLAAAEPFEAAFALSKDDQVKASIAEYLKNIYYRFQDKDAKYKEGYEKYNAYLK